MTAEAHSEDHAPQDQVAHFLAAPVDGLLVAGHLDAIAAQAVAADRSREIDPALIAAIKGSDVMRMSATAGIGGIECSVCHIGRELEAVAARCPNLAWTLWNHLCVFHLFVGCLGPQQRAFLRGIVEAGEWVSFPAGAGSRVHGRIDVDHAVLDGVATFGTGARYGDWCGVVFAVTDADGTAATPPDLRFTMVRVDSPGVEVDATWDGSGLRASATDHVHYRSVRVPLERCVAWHGANRAESLRSVEVVDHRYREDWVGLSDLWLGWMAVGLVREALAEAAAEFRHRKAIMGSAMIERPTVQINVGHALALTGAARAAVTEACREVDARIAGCVVPDAADYYRQQAVISMALEQLGEAMSILARTYGGNGLREGGSFERRRRDFAAMPLHINAHRDRVTHQVGRLALGIPLDRF